MKNRTKNFYALALLTITINWSWAEAARESNDRLCRACISTHYQSARDSIIRAWTVLDMLRSTTIDPKDRNAFAQEMFEDVLRTLTDLNALAVSCQFCTEQYRKRAEDIAYLEQLLQYMAEAFAAVFVPMNSGEEWMLQMSMLQSAKMMESIKSQLQL